MKEKEDKKQILFLRIMNDIIGKDYLKLMKLSIHWLKGFEVQVEFYEKDKK